MHPVGSLAGGAERVLNARPRRRPNGEPPPVLVLGVGESSSEVLDGPASRFGAGEVAG